MLRIYKTCRKLTGLIFTIFVAVQLSSSAAPAATTTTAAVLQHCPAVEAEIVDLEMLAGALRGSNAVGFMEKIKLKGSVCVKCWSSVTICFYVRASKRECWELLGSLPIPTLNADRANTFILAPKQTC